MNKIQINITKYLNKVCRISSLIIVMILFFVLIVVFNAIGHSVYYMIFDYQEPEIGAVCMVDKNNIQILDTGKVVDLKTTAALVSEITLMHSAEKYKCTNQILVIKGGQNDCLEYFIYDERKHKAIGVLRKPLPNSQWLRKQYIFINSVNDTKISIYLNYIEENKNWIYIQ